MFENPQLSEEETKAQRGRATDPCHRAKGKTLGVSFTLSLCRSISKVRPKNALTPFKKKCVQLEVIRTLQTFVVALIYDAFVGVLRAEPSFASSAGPGL